jgi:hypothetical protein
MAALDLSAAQAARKYAGGQQVSAPIQSLLMQIYADAVCWVRTQFQHVRNCIAGTHWQCTVAELGLLPSCRGCLQAVRHGKRFMLRTGASSFVLTAYFIVGTRHANS